ncbi:hypothetical protein BT96DRAFT_948609 [Gymnopus androsaceus JB14]|uniref:DUF6534 domain-containing protein n=1 Tax=Gymnopus androsaceus JB14 TaxID=1447944 RepID=A0A6A4GPF2_9AGAR|nr:hypothetical protein BT96DRAFT_948609 [Gymnopus androsaceus JB14]
MAQLYFIQKIYILQKNMFIIVPTTILAVSAWGTLLIQNHNLNLGDLQNPTVVKIDIAQKISSTLVEVLIAGFMCHFFRSMQTGLRSTDTMIKCLVIFAASRGLLLSIFQILDTVVYFASSNKPIWVSFHYMVG